MILGFVFALFVQPALPLHIAPLVAEARSIAGSQGDSIWPGFSKTPYPVLFVGKNDSFLFCPAGAAKGFVTLYTDPFTKCTIKTRKRVFAANLKATFPAVDGISTVVIGAPALTEGSNAAWIATLLHEHFHQMQMSQPGYYEAVKALDLSGGKTGGMWMLNFPFPYQDTRIADAFADMAHALKKALRTRTGSDLQKQTAIYRLARTAAFASISTRDGQYAEFQLWQEGVARYSEIALAEAAIERARRGESPYDYSALAMNLRGRVLENLEHFNLAQNKRVSFYALGAGEALLLDRIRPNWRTAYFHAGLAMGPLLEKTSLPGLSK
ncbi:MAG: hypothetical protein COA85_02255 [Robiginitomaculum sp.]|nr:MAG: hypothetical protein COA85_02255 [Robiginitomaculum sp.]